MTIDFLKLEGTIPECSDALIILVKIGAKVLLHCFTIAVGTGSRLHCLLGHPRISFWISSSFVEQSVSNLEVAGTSNSCGSAPVCSACRPSRR